MARIEPRAALPYQGNLGHPASIARSRASRSGRSGRCRPSSGPGPGSVGCGSPLGSSTGASAWSLGSAQTCVAETNGFHQIIFWKRYNKLTSIPPPSTREDREKTFVCHVDQTQVSHEQAPQADTLHHRLSGFFTRKSLSNESTLDWHNLPLRCQWN